MTYGVEQSLRAFAKGQRRIGYGVIAVPDSDFRTPFILAAWGRMLEMDNYDPRMVVAFLAEYMGHGPENDGLDE
jgi:hypothetical protein